MRQSDNQVIRHLKITFTIQEYIDIIKNPKYQDRDGDFFSQLAGDDYWDRIPWYLLARCPLCDAVYVGAIDTHSLIPWFGSGSGSKDKIFLPKKKPSATDIERRVPEIQAACKLDCRHFVGVYCFVNLNGVEPVEKRYFSNGSSEVPFVMPLFLDYDDNFASYVVMHSLPVCRIENDKFVPRYSLYILTYYSARPFMLWEWRYQEKRREHHFPADMYSWRDIRDVPEARNLPLWVERGKLLWLDLEQDHLPLKGGPADTFPYSHIEGIDKSFIYREGQFLIGH